MQQVIEARVSPQKVWEAWERAHQLHGEQEENKGLQSGIQGRSRHSTTGGKKGFRYYILNVVPGKSFSILWKTFFVRLIFTHSVRPTKRGSEISYEVQIKGLFAWPVRWLLGGKIKSNIDLVLKQIVKRLEDG